MQKVIFRVGKDEKKRCKKYEGVGLSRGRKVDAGLLEHLSE